MPTTKKTPKKSSKSKPLASGRLLPKRLRFSRRQSLITAGVLGVIGVAVVVITFASSLMTSTSPNAVILSYSLPHIDEPIGPNIEAAHSSPLVLYGNGLAVCGSKGDENADSQESLTSTVLKPAQIQNLVQRIANTGFLSLNPEYFNKFPIAEKQEIIRLSVLSGDHLVRYYNDGPAPAAYTATKQIILDFCKSVTTPYLPNQVTIRTKAAADPRGRAVAPADAVVSDLTATADVATNKSIKATLGEAFNKVNSQSTSNLAVSEKTLSGPAAQTLVKKLNGRTHVFAKGAKGVTEIAVTKELPVIKNVPKQLNYAESRKRKKLGFVGKLADQLASLTAPAAQADGSQPVRVVVLIGNDESINDGNSKLAAADAWGRQIHDWYCAQIGRCYPYLGASVMRGRQNVGYYLSGSAVPLENVLRNVASADSGTIFRSDMGTQLITGFGTNSLSYGVCGIGFIGQALGAIDPSATGYNTSGRPFCSKPTSMSHEFGHNVGLDHTGNGTLMDGSPYTRYAAKCGIGSDNYYPGCRLDSGQASAVRANGTGTTYFAPGPPPTPTPVPPLANTCTSLATAAGSDKYWIMGRDGGVFGINAPFYGSVPQSTKISNAVGIVSTPNQLGYYIYTRTGAVYAYGNAGYKGGANATNVAGFAVRPQNDGYWLFGRDGGVFSYGAAPFRNSLPGLNAQVNNIVGGVSSLSGNGYWMVGSDGGVFAFGDAPFYGSMGGKFVAAPIVGMQATVTGRGYWLVGADGGIYAYGDATFYGSMGGKGLSQPVVSFTRTPSGRGYWMLGADGAIYSFGDAKYAGRVSSPSC